MMSCGAMLVAKDILVIDGTREGIISKVEGWKEVEESKNLELGK